jgi:hypothetical protein
MFGAIDVEDDKAPNFPKLTEIVIYGVPIGRILCSRQMHLLN